MATTARSVKVAIDERLGVVFGGAIPMALWLAVGAAAGAAPGNVTHGCVDRVDPAVDYFPDKVQVTDATGFSVDYRRTYKVVSVGAGTADGRPARYVLVQCGAATPPLTGPLAGAEVVTVPVTSLFSASTTQLSMLVNLGRLDVLTGVPRLRDLTGEAVKARAATGLVREFAPASVIDPEVVVARHPSVFMTGGTWSSTLSVIRRAGVPVVADTEWLEPTAVGRAEWLKYLALFVNEEARAARVYAAMKARYVGLRARAQSEPAASRPLVMTGKSTRGVFTIAGGRSYVAALIEDAGGRYVWADNPSTGAPSVDLEAQIHRAANADIWINGGGWPTLAAMLDEEPRYVAFKAYRTGRVWVYDELAKPGGGTDYWSRSVSHPDLVLADLVEIFHPSLLPGRPFEWYVRVPRR